MSSELNELRAKYDHAAVKSELNLITRLEQAERNADTYQMLYEQRAESLEQAERAVARVREVCESDSYDMHKDYGNGELVVPVDSIMNALDGDTRG